MKDATPISPGQRKKLEAAKDLLYELYWDLEQNHAEKTIVRRAETLLSKAEQLEEMTYSA